MAVLWTIIFILVIALIAICGYCFIYWIENDKNPVSAAVETGRKETMIANNQFCANCKYVNDKRYYDCNSPRLTYDKINPVTGKNEKHTYNVDTRCKEIIGSKYCQWEAKEN